MVRVLKQVLNDDIGLGSLLLIPPWYGLHEFKPWHGMVRVLKHVLMTTFALVPFS